MRSLATFDGRRGEIAIIENRTTGARSYFEDGVLQFSVPSVGDYEVAEVTVA